jgi:hypothetical protein
MQDAHAVPHEMDRVASGEGRHGDVINAPSKGPLAHQLSFFEAEGLQQVVAREQVSVEPLHREATTHWRRIRRKKYAVFGDQRS